VGSLESLGQLGCRRAARACPTITDHCQPSFGHAATMLARNLGVGHEEDEGESA